MMVLAYMHLKGVNIFLKTVDKKVKDILLTSQFHTVVTDFEDSYNIKALYYTLHKEHGISASYYKDIPRSADYILSEYKLYFDKVEKIHDNMIIGFNSRKYAFKCTKIGKDDNGNVKEYTVFLQLTTSLHKIKEFSDTDTFEMTDFQVFLDSSGKEYSTEQLADMDTSNLEPHIQIVDNLACVFPKDAGSAIKHDLLKEAMDSSELEYKEKKERKNYIVWKIHKEGGKYSLSPKSVKTPNMIINIDNSFQIDTAQYINRVKNNIDPSVAEALILDGAEERENVLIVGPRGVGKTTFFSNVKYKLSKNDKLRVIQVNSESFSKMIGTEEFQTFLDTNFKDSNTTAVFICDESQKMLLPDSPNVDVLTQMLQGTYTDEYNIMFMLVANGDCKDFVQDLFTPNRLEFIVTLGFLPAEKANRCVEDIKKTLIGTTKTFNQKSYEHLLNTDTVLSKVETPYTKKGFISISQIATCKENTKRVNKFESKFDAIVDGNETGNVPPPPPA